MAKKSEKQEENTEIFDQIINQVSEVVIIKGRIQQLLDTLLAETQNYKQVHGRVQTLVTAAEECQKSIDVLRQGKVDYEFRSTIVPSLHTKEDIIKMAKWISGAKRYYLQNFRPEKTIDPKFEKIKPYSQEFLLEIQRIIAPFFEACQVR